MMGIDHDAEFLRIANRGCVICSRSCQSSPATESAATMRGHDEWLISVFVSERPGYHDNVVLLDNG